MDLVTHVALGVVVAEAFADTRNRKQMLITGAFVQSFPDIDVIGALWLRPDVNVMFHRGITHSLLAAIVFPLLFTVVQTKIFRDQTYRPSRWLIFFIVEYGLHLFIDSFNAYGIGLFEPFTNHKYSLHALFVLDPIIVLITVSTAGTLLVLRDIKIRRWVVAGSLSLITVYLGYALRNRFVTEQYVAKRLASEQIEYSRLLITPTGFNSWLWFIAAESDSGYFVLHRSVFERNDIDSITFFPRRHHLLSKATNESTLRNLRDLSEGFYTLEEWSDTLVFNVLRFGQIQGWVRPSNPFNFHYFLNYPQANKTVMQRGRVRGWNKTALRSLLSRIKGEPTIPKKIRDG